MAGSSRFRKGKGKGNSIKKDVKKFKGREDEGQTVSFEERLGEGRGHSKCVHLIKSGVKKIRG